MSQCPEPSLEAPYDPYSDGDVETTARDLVWDMFSPDGDDDCLDDWLEKNFPDIDDRHAMFIRILKEMLDEDGDWKAESDCAYKTTASYRVWRQHKAKSLFKGKPDLSQEKEAYPTTWGVVKEYFEEVLTSSDDYYQAFEDLFWPDLGKYLATHQTSEYGENYGEFVFDFKSDEVWNKAIEKHQATIRHYR